MAMGECSTFRYGRRQRGGRGAAAPVPYAPPFRLPPVVMRKKYACPLDPTHPLSQRKVYVKINEMSKHCVQLVLNFFLFLVVNGQRICC